MTKPAAVTEDGTLYVKGKGNYTGVITIAVKKVDKNSLKKITVTPDKNYKPEYDGEEHAPKFTVSAKNLESGYEMTEGVDYYVAYPKNMTDAGTVKYTVVGMGDFTGSVSKSYKISPRKATADQITISFDEPEGGFEFNPAGVSVNKADYNWSVTYKADGTPEELILGKDYKVSYSGNKKVGTNKASVKLSFLGNYKGSKATPKTFSIKAVDLSTIDSDRIKVAIPDKIVKKAKTLGKSTPIVTVDGVTVKSSGYNKVKYYLDATFEKEVTKDDMTFDDSKSKTIYVKIEGKGNYTGTIDAELCSYEVRMLDENQYDLSKAKVKFTQKGKYSYTGLEVEPEKAVTLDEAKAQFTVSLKVNGTEVVLDPEQYEVAYMNNVNKGKATIVITGTGEAGTNNSYAFVGSKNATFSIVAQKVTNEVFQDTEALGSGMLDALKKLAE